MKWLVFTAFLVAFGSSLLWFDSDEGKRTPLQKMTLGVIALIGWGIVVVVGAII
jgi:hypothetical protein